MMMTGLAALGSVAAILSSMFIATASDEASESSEHSSGEIAEELRALRAEVAGLKSTIEESST